MVACHEEKEVSHRRSDWGMGPGQRPLHWPNDVEVDAAGNLYVADTLNHRVQVFDSSGAYLTTIGGSWGSQVDQFRHPTGVDVDAAGNVYIADNDNHCIQKYAPGELLYLPLILR